MPATIERPETTVTLITGATPGDTRLSDGQTVGDIRRHLPDETVIPVMRPSWRQLASNCVQVSLKVKWWRAGASLTLDDLGLGNAPLEFQEWLASYARLGRQTLLPAEPLRELKSLEVQARNTLNNKAGGYGWPSPWGQGYLVPVAAWPVVRDRLQRIEATFQATSAEIRDRMSEYRETVLREYRPKAIQRALISLGYGANHPVGSLLGSDRERFEAAVQSHLDMLGGLFPDAVQLAESYRFEWSVTYVDMPRVLDASIQVDTLEARIAELQEQATASAEEHRRIVERLTMDEERLAAEQRLNAEQEELRLKREALEAQLAHQREIDEMIRTKAASQLEREVESVLGQVSLSVMEMLHAACRDVTANLTEKGKFHPKALQRLLNTVEQVRKLDFSNSAEVEALGKKIRETVDAAKEKTATVEDVKRTLSQIETITRAQIIQVGRNCRMDLDFDPTHGLAPVTAREYNRAKDELFAAPVAAPLGERAASRGAARSL